MSVQCSKPGIVGDCRDFRLLDPVRHVEHHMNVLFALGNPAESKSEDLGVGIVPRGLIDLGPVPGDVGEMAARSSLASQKSLSPESLYQLQEHLLI